MIEIHPTADLLDRTLSWFKFNELMFRDGDRCRYCTRQFSRVLLPTIDHVIPKSRGGRNFMRNYALACFSCNHDKKDMLEHEFIEEYALILIKRAGLG